MAIWNGSVVVTASPAGEGRALTLRTFDPLHSSTKRNTPALAASRMTDGRCLFADPVIAGNTITATSWVGGRSTA